MSSMLFVPWALSRQPCRPQPWALLDWGESHTYTWIYHAEQRYSSLPQQQLSSSGDMWCLTVLVEGEAATLYCFVHEGAGGSRVCRGRSPAQDDGPATAGLFLAHCQCAGAGCWLSVCNTLWFWLGSVPCAWGPGGWEPVRSWPQAPASRVLPGLCVARLGILSAGSGGKAVQLAGGPGPGTGTD